MFTKLYRVLMSVDYKGQRERELYYTENENDARKRYALQKEKVIKFAKDNGLDFFDDDSTPDYYMNIYACGNEKGKPYTGAVAQFKTEEFGRTNFLDLSEGPIF